MSRAPCIPDTLPLTDLNWRRLLPIAGKANAALARYDGMLQTLPNPGVLLSPITVNEAVLSSRIEGTQATLDEVLEFDAGMEAPNARLGDIEEVSNYRVAVQIAEAALAERPLSLSLIKSVHQRLMQGVRGRDKDPGAFRSDQNWIGRSGDPIEKARFIPPSPLVLPQALEEWEAYIGSEDEDPILQTSIAHAQFEILHPFKDGNGRIGRMLIPLLLYQRRALSRPMFYLSEYLEARRDIYYDKLLDITNRGKWQEWIEFFVDAIIAQAEANLDKVRAVRDLYEEMRRRFVEITHSQFAMAAVDVFFMKPIIQGPEFSKLANFNNRITANEMLRKLEAAGAIKKLREGSGQKPAVYAMPELINITEGRAVL
ncbi:Fic family protein [Roseomonas mucosa]|uniref:Fic family protein n=1 Tax=Roseomonas mucosa TaxID=207340 RepID=A0A4Y1N120_9PROT|nr:Fic family protein [Roseomonas mucosa]QDJ10887.1 Fic family protein [Roseomonas mucosa]